MTKTADQKFVRALNTSLVMNVLRQESPLSRARISEHTGLNRSTVSSIMNQLLEDGFVVETTLPADNAMGRPGILIELNPLSGAAVGLEIAVDYIAVVLANFVGEIVFRKRVDSNPKDAQDVIMQKSEHLVQDAFDFAATLPVKVLGIGVGLSGLVDRELGRLVYAPNLNWYDLPIRDLLSEKFGVPVIPENEANAGAFGELKFGNAQDVDNFIYLSTGVGLGGGIVLKGDLHQGYAGFGGEIGHMAIYGRDRGEMCGCGQRGCWETYVSPPNVLREIRSRLMAGEASGLREILKEKDFSDLKNEDVFAMIEAKDELVLSVMDETAKHFALGIANLINLYNPERILLGGVWSGAADVLIPAIKKGVENLTQPFFRDGFSILPSKNGADSCLTGLIALVLEGVFAQPTLQG